MHPSLLAQTQPHHNTLGMIIVGVPLLWGILKCLSIAARKTTNKKAVYSLALILTFWHLLFVLHGIGVLNGANIKQFTNLFVAILLGSAISTAIIAVLGLLEIRKSKLDQRELEAMVEQFGPSDGDPPPRARVYTQGRRQAIAALFLSSTVLVLFTIGVVKGTLRVRAQREPQPAERLVFADFNFTFTTPGGAWRRDKPEQPTIVLALANPHVPLAFAISAETRPPAMPIDGRALGEMAVTGIEENADELRRIEAKAYAVHDLEDFREVVETQTKGARYVYVIWAYAHNGYLYWLTTWGPFAAVDEIKKASDMMIEGFSLLDPSATTPQR